MRFLYSYFQAGKTLNTFANLFVYQLACHCLGACIAPAKLSPQVTNLRHSGESVCNAHQSRWPGPIVLIMFMSRGRNTKGHADTDVQLKTLAVLLQKDRERLVTNQLL